MASAIQMIPVGWEFEVPVWEIEEARLSLAGELEGFYHTPVAQLTDLDVARYLVRTATPRQRYLRFDALTAVQT